MLEWDVGARHLYIRDVGGEAEFHEVEQIQREAWSFSDLDIVPMAHLVAAKRAGGMVLGAFEGTRMIGFVYGFPGYEEGHASIHSHMLAVRREYRNLHAGLYLKLAQREDALSRGIREITWTFDPLQSLNANLNFSRLGVVSRRYIVNFYGEATSSPLHQGFGTDRLWVSWWLDSDRVAERVRAASSGEMVGSPAVENAPFLVRDNGGPVVEIEPGLTAPACLIEIPDQITTLKQRDPHRARKWREATREAFLAALGAGFTVTDFPSLAQTPPRWAYLLQKTPEP